MMNFKQLTMNLCAEFEQFQEYGDRVNLQKNILNISKNILSF